MDNLILISVLILGIVTGIQSIPSGYILDVNPSCSTDNTTDATILITSDLYVKITAKCNGWDVSGGVISGNDVSQTVTVKYSGKPGADDGNCYFKNPVDNAGLYWIDVDLAWGLEEHSANVQTQTYRITCTYSGNVNKETVTANLADSPFAPDEIQNNMGTTISPGDVTIELVDVRGNDLSGTTIPMGKKVQIKATISGGSPGATPLSCDAVTSADRYTILTGGCGDGVVFAANVGFTTAGTAVTSPYFKFFQVGAQTGLKFECNFTACTQACDGVSCFGAVARRRRRSVDQQIDGVQNVPQQQSGQSPGSPSDLASIFSGISDEYQCKDSKHHQIRSPGIGKMQSTGARVSNRLESPVSVLVILSIIGTLVIISLFISLYVCTRQERQSRCSNNNHNGKPCYCILNKPI